MGITESLRVATPDFYDYERRAPSTVRVDDRFVVVAWDDGVELAAFDLWLYENAVGIGTDPSTREGLVDPAELPDDLAVVDARIDADGELVVVFGDGRSSRFASGWLRHVAERRHVPDAWLPEPVAWTAATMPIPPTHDGAHIDDDPAVLERFVDDLVRFGVARLRGVPIDPDLGDRLGRRLGGIRTTNFGTLWDVQALDAQDGDSDTNSTANTTARLGPHTDLPTRETPPGFQFLHCLRNAAVGGGSTFADGAAIVEHLREHDPDDFEALTTLRWIFANRGRGIDHRWSGPLIDLGVTGSPLTLRAFYPVRAFPDMDPADVPRAYDALRRFSRLAADPRFEMRFVLEPGDLVGFDNRRVLHGREQFERTGARHLRGWYVDHDEIRSFARVANRAAEARRREEQRPS